MRQGITTQVNGNCGMSPVPAPPARAAEVRDAVNTVDPDPGGGLNDGGLGIARVTWIGFGGREFAPNAGLATREEQIIVGQRIYAQYGWDPWGCAHNVLHWV